MKPPRRETARFECPSGAAGAEVPPAELLEQLLVAMDDPPATLDPGLRRESPGDACSSSRLKIPHISAPWHTFLSLLSKPGGHAGQQKTPLDRSWRGSERS